MSENNNEKSYKIGIEGEGIKVNQQISKQKVLRVLNVIMGSSDSDRLDIEVGKDIIRSAEIARGAGQSIDPKMFMATKKPLSDVERITCLAYYLSHYRGITQFKTRELTDLNTEASQPRFSNPTVAARNAVQQQYLSLAGGGRKQITVRGEAVVNALPDRDKVKKALEENILRGKRRYSKKVTKAAKKREELKN